MPPKGTNPWVAHVKNYKRNHPGLTYKNCMKEARPSYHGTQKVEVSGTTEKRGLNNIKC